MFLLLWLSRSDPLLIFSRLFLFFLIKFEELLFIKYTHILSNVLLLFFQFVVFVSLCLSLFYTLIFLMFVSLNLSTFFVTDFYFTSIIWKDSSPQGKIQSTHVFLSFSFFDITKYNLKLLFAPCLPWKYCLPFGICSNGSFLLDSHEGHPQCERTDFRDKKSCWGAKQKTAVGSISQTFWCIRTALKAAVLHQTSAQHIYFPLDLTNIFLDTYKECVRSKIHYFLS